MFSDKTIYRLIDLGLLEVRNIDLPRKVRFRPRRKGTTVYKVDKTCLIGRTYEDFLEYMKKNTQTLLLFKWILLKVLKVVKSYLLFIL